jgi:hypothetical protein
MHPQFGATVSACLGRLTALAGSSKLGAQLKGLN